MRITGRVAQVYLLLMCAASLLFIVVGWWLIIPLAGSAAAQPPEQEEPSPGESGQLPAGQPSPKPVSRVAGSS